jgi:hypothetical protein
MKVTTFERRRRGRCNLFGVGTLTHMLHAFRVVGFEPVPFQMRQGTVADPGKTLPNFPKSMIRIETHSRFLIAPGALQKRSVH